MSDGAAHSFAERIAGMRAFFARMRLEHGDVIAREIEKAYLTGISHGCAVSADFGAFAQYTIDTWRPS